MTAVGFNLPTIDARSSPIFEISGLHEEDERFDDMPPRRDARFHPPQVDVRLLQLYI